MLFVIEPEGCVRLAVPEYPTTDSRRGSVPAMPHPMYWGKRSGPLAVRSLWGEAATERRARARPAPDSAVYSGLRWPAMPAWSGWPASRALTERLHQAESY